MAPTLVDRCGDDVGGHVRPQGPRPGPADLPRRGPAPPREAAVATGRASVDGPRRHVPHPDQPRPRSRRPVVSGVRRRRGSREGEARRRPHVRPAQGRRVHGHDDGDAGVGSPAPGRARSCWSTSKRSATAFTRPSVCETFDGQPLPPATVRRLACEADIIPIGPERRGQGRRRRTGETSRQRRSTTSVASDAPDVRGTRTARCASVTATSTT